MQLLKSIKQIQTRIRDFSVYYRSQKKIGKRIELSVTDMLFMLINEHGELTRYDIIVRYLAIENFYAKNDYGFKLYEKMQDARKGYGYSKDSVSRFIELIESYDKNGYNKDSYIIVDKDLSLIDGSHRIAMGLYHNVETICALVLNTSKPVDYSIDWFLCNDFSREEIELILAKTNELLNYLNRPFSCIIWSPAVHLADEIIKDLSYYGTVIDFQNYTYEPSEYINIVRAIYDIDDIKKWKIDKKIEYMQKYDGKLVAVNLQFQHPDFRIKKVSTLPISKYGERVKKVIRTKYKKYINDYYFDIILHIADNYMQSDYMHKILDGKDVDK